MVSLLAGESRDADAPAVAYRRCGDDNLLVEYGPMVLDLGLRMRVHALAERIAAERPARRPGPHARDPLAAGARAIPTCCRSASVLDLAREVEDELPATRDARRRPRTVHLPLSWDDPGHARGAPSAT